MQLTLEICHLYPDLMNLYGDRGNVIALWRRCIWRGIEARVTGVSLSSSSDLSQFDILFLGGGQDREQKAICYDFARVKAPQIRKAVEDGTPFLAICGGYQLLGEYYQTGSGEKLPGLGIMDLYTVAGRKRLIGNVVAQSDLAGSGPARLVGFENHSGKTYLGRGVKPLARVLSGYGNNGEDGLEGAVYKNAVGTYLHGALLPKNPWLADWLISQALKRKYGRAEIAPLDDTLELMAQESAARRAAKR
ncbi:MAG TPA: glutamine amidotransferase [Firmicutes bacterium]|nr:glutamine amidotransferase [Bacillota bacterium]